MRQTRLLSLAVVGIFLLASSAISMAGDWDWGGPPGTTDREGSYESRETMEAGKLPSGEGTMSSDSGSRSDESVQTIRLGGTEFRVDIDTGP